MTCAVVAASGFNEVTEFAHESSQSDRLVPDDEYQLVMLDSVGDGMVYAVATQTGPPCFTLSRKDHFIPGRCSSAVHGCASSARYTTINQSSVVDA